MESMNQSSYRSTGLENSMGKRSNFERKPRDYYPTPIEAVEPLINHLPYSFTYIEPCAGDGRLVKHISKLTDGAGKCLYMGDIEPRGEGVMPCDALKVKISAPLAAAISMIITNPPWERSFLHAFIDKWLPITPMWLLFDADWMHTKQSAMLMTYCKKVVSIGRVKWIEGSKQTGKDNCAWYYFKDERTTGKALEPTQFYGRIM